MIYAIGDSYTYGEELTDLDLAWPAVLGRMLNRPVTNLGRPGSGNHRIVKRTLDTVLNGQAELIVIAWSDPARQEFSDEYGTYDIWPGCKWTAGDLSHRNALSKYITAYDSEEYYYVNWLRQVILVQTLCRAHGIPVVMSVVYRNYHAKYQAQYQHLIKHIDTANFVGWPYDTLSSWTYHLPAGPGKHPLEAGHKLIAEKYYEIAKHIRH